jgi:hypothetical protein
MTLTVPTLDVHIAWPQVAPEIPAEMRGCLGFILHDFQSTDVIPSYRPRMWQKCQTLPQEKWYGLPETEKLGDAQFEQMNETWQWFWFAWLDYYSPATVTMATIKKRWSDLTAGNKAFCNKHGGINNPNTDKAYADYINGTNLHMDPMAQENATTAGNPVILTGNSRSIAGAPFLGVWCLDRTQAPLALLDHPARDCFIHSAVVCRPEQGSEPNFPAEAPAPHGTYIVNNFPHCDGNKVPVPLVSARGRLGDFMGIPVRENWIRQTRLCRLRDYEFPIGSTVR